MSRLARPEGRWFEDQAVPAEIRREARRLRARGVARCGGLNVVVLPGGDVWLDDNGRQVGRSPSGPVKVRSDVPWPVAADPQVTQAAAGR